MSMILMKLMNLYTEKKTLLYEYSQVVVRFIDQTG